MLASPMLTKYNSANIQENQTIRTELTTRSKKTSLANAPTRAHPDGPPRPRAPRRLTRARARERAFPTDAS